MLVLTRKIGEAIAIGDEIKVKLLEIKGGQIKLGIEAPHRISVHREEVFTRIMAENKRAAQDSGSDLNHAASLIGKKR
jgi:carbon storage regulator